MNVAWLLYSIAIAAAVGIVAASLEFVLRPRHVSIRWLWLCAMGLSLGILVAVALTRSTPADVPPMLAQAAIDRARSFDGPLPQAPTATPIVSEVPHTLPPLPRDGVLVKALRVLPVLSLLIVPLLVFVESTRLRIRRRSWREDVADGTAVLVSDDFGPAVVGVFRPRIVIPEYCLALPGRERALLLLHEQEHVRSHDGRLAALALTLLALFPWNPLLWWQFNRLRLAIEIDCDQRVVHAHGGDVRVYGNLLIDVAARLGGSMLYTTAFLERRQWLRRRLAGLAPSPRELSMRRAAGALAVTMLVVISACVVPRPASSPLQAATGSLHSLPSHRADSIFALRGDTLLAVAAATNLPTVFEIDTTYGQPSSFGDAYCGSHLIDPRSGTRLLEVRSHHSVQSASRGDTVVTTSSGVGYYRVVGASRYGVSPQQLLRVGCASRVDVAVAGRPLGRIVTTLTTLGDDRARALARQLTDSIGFAPDSLELRPRRVHIAFDARQFTPTSDSARFARSWQIAIMIWHLHARAARAETVTVSVNSQLSTAMASFYPPQLEHPER